jgi:ribonuclease-3
LSAPTSDTFRALAELCGLSAESPLLHTALTHASYGAEHGVSDNERLEFLGDAVVDLAVTDLILSRYGHLDEGGGSAARSQVVNERALATVARQLDLGAQLLVGRGVEKEGGRERDSLLADTFEAVVAAIYLEAGFDRAKTFVHEQLGAAVAKAAKDPHAGDPKTRLLSWTEAHGFEPPTYDTDGVGAEHNPLFTSRVIIDGTVRGEATGRTKKAAELAAALTVLEDING